VKVLVPACLLLGLIALTARADIIYFKDGMKTICREKAWEEDGEVKCEYAGWILSYQKEDVLRIEKTIPEKPAAQREKKDRIIQTTQNDTVTKEITPSKAKGPVFYDPRRPYKYWTGKNSKHKSYNEAIQTLAKRYESTPQWIQAHMGNTNDLWQIHQNLAEPNLSRDIPVAKPPATKPSGIVFYNPRRPFPYWAGGTSKYKSYKEAIQALAKKYGRSPEWIRANMGTANDLKEIHQNLRTRLKTN